MNDAQIAHRQDRKTREAMHRNIDRNYPVAVDVPADAFFLPSASIPAKKYSFSPYPAHPAGKADPAYPVLL